MSQKLENTNEEEIILTNEEINDIIKYAEDNPPLKYPYVIGFGSEKTAVWKVTPKNNIIIIKGDKYTGFEHINDRHNYWSEQPFWNENNNGEFILDNPSKFNKNSLPIVEYADVADKLYNKEFLNIEKNKAPELFDLYIGKIDDGTSYKMLLYKNTKILHTLFPEKKIHNKNKNNIINYHKGNTFGKYENGEYTIETPWFNEKNQVIYNLVFFIDLINKKEKCILINSKKEMYIELFEGDKSKISTLSDEVKYIGFSDFTLVEKKIKKFEKIINDSKK